MSADPMLKVCMTATSAVYGLNRRKETMHIFTKRSYTEKYEPEHVYVFTGPCVVTKKPYTVTVPAEALFALNQGEHVQVACPTLGADDREFILNGVSPEGWKQVFGEEDDDE